MLKLLNSLRAIHRKLGYGDTCFIWESVTHCPFPYKLPTCKGDTREGHIYIWWWVLAKREGVGHFRRTESNTTLPNVFIIPVEGKFPLWMMRLRIMHSWDILTAIKKKYRPSLFYLVFSTHDGHKDFGFSLPSRLFNNLVSTLCLILTLSYASSLMLQKWDIISAETRKLLEALFGLTVGCSVRKIML